MEPPQGLTRILTKQDFDAESFVKKQIDPNLSNCISSLSTLRKELDNLKSSTSSQLKKNVYQNYEKFIETAHEISILEGEMYQMSHLLTDQKKNLNQMMDINLTNEKTDMEKKPFSKNSSSSSSSSSSNFPSKITLSYLLEKVQNCSKPLAELGSSHLLLESDFQEHHPETLVSIATVHLFLLSNCIIVTSLLNDSSSKQKYKLENIYNINNLIIKNIKENNNIKNSFKIIIFPHTRIFSNITFKEKKKWFDTILELKKNNKEKQINNDIESEIELNRKWKEEDDWLLDVPEELDVFISQRDFEGAVDLILKTNDFLNKNPDFENNSDVKSRLNNRTNKLIEIASQELQMRPERNIRGGNKNSKKLSIQLIKLNKTSLAFQLLLENWSQILSFQLKQLTNETNTFNYMHKLCKLFFSNLLIIHEDFKYVFSDHFHFYSSFIVWIEKEIKNFSIIFNEQVFINKVDVVTIANCVSVARQQCQQLSAIGLDMIFYLDRLLFKNISLIIHESTVSNIEAIKHRIKDDRMKGTNFQKEELLENFEQQFKSFGFLGISNYKNSNQSTTLTTNTIEFLKSFRILIKNFLLLINNQLINIIITSITSVISFYVDYLLSNQIESRLSEINSDNQKALIDMKSIKNSNIIFIRDEFLPWVTLEVKGQIHQPIEQLEEIRQKIINNHR